VGIWVLVPSVINGFFETCRRVAFQAWHSVVHFMVWAASVTFEKWTTVLGSVCVLATPALIAVQIPSMPGANHTLFFRPGDCVAPVLNVSLEHTIIFWVGNPWVGLDNPKNSQSPLSCGSQLYGHVLTQAMICESTQVNPQPSTVMPYSCWASGEGVPGLSTS